MNNTIVVTTYNINLEGRKRVQCVEKQITQAQLESYAEQLKDYLLKIDYTRTRSYDNSDDDRVTDSFSKWDGVKYCEIEPLNNSKHLVVDGDTVVGVMFEVRDSNCEKTHVFLFNGEVQESMSLGYSASHSSDWTYVNTVTLVKRGENGAPQEGYSLRFCQSKMYPSI